MSIELVVEIFLSLKNQYDHFKNTEENFLLIIKGVQVSSTVMFMIRLLLLATVCFVTLLSVLSLVYFNTTTPSSVYTRESKINTRARQTIANTTLYHINVGPFERSKFRLAEISDKNSRGTLSNDEGNALISHLFEKGRPFVAGRLSMGAELCLLSAFKRGENPIRPCGQPHRLSGIYPETPDMLRSFARNYQDSLQMLTYSDVMATFGQPSETEILKHLPVTIVKNRAIEPFYFEEPWSVHLKGKSVLIVHAFIPSIKCQLRRAQKLFSSPKILPPFKAKFVHMPQALGGKTPHGSYMETLSFVKKNIDAEGPFDVAIIAAGAYAMPLAMHCKIKHNATAIAMGGGSQLLFGLKGHRWDTHPKVSKLYNKNWMYPLEVDTPSNAKSIERGGPYWGPKAKRLTECPLPTL